MISRWFFVALLLVSLTLAIANPGVLRAANDQPRVTGQLLDMQGGYIFFTTGDAFRIAPTLIVRNAAGTGTTTLVPGPRVYARAVFSSDGAVIELDLSRTPLATEGSMADVTRFAVTLSSPLPNPDIAAPTPNAHGYIARHTGKDVEVDFIAQVPPTTPLTASVYLMTDTSGWNPQAIRMDRVDALHFRVIRTLVSGTMIHYLYTRGSLTTVERSPTGLEVKPRVLDVTDADIRTIHSLVSSWADQGAASQIGLPQSLPTPYNPNPFGNLPSTFPTPHAR